MTGPGTGDPLLAAVQADLLARRIVMLRGPLDEAAAGHLSALLMTLGAAGDDPVSLVVDSGGGPLEAAWTVIDTIDLLGVPVEATCTGRAEGTAVAVVAVASHRLATPHARFRLSLPTGSLSGRATELERWAREVSEQTDRFTARLAEATGRPFEHLEAELTAGRWMGADEARAAGLVDEVVQTRNGPATGSPPLGFGPPRRP